MIAVFPTVYPDELLYSQLARFYARSGFPGYTFAAEDLFENKAVRPDIEFLNAYTPEALRLITDAISQMILNGQIAYVENDTKVDIVEFKYTVFKVRILEGIYKGVECWTIMEAVQMVD